MKIKYTMCVEKHNFLAVLRMIFLEARTARKSSRKAKDDLITTTKNGWRHQFTFNE